MQDFFSMGGYAPYVWGAYGLTALVVGGLVISSWRRLRAAERALRLAEQLRARRRSDQESGEAGDGVEP